MRDPQTTKHTILVESGRLFNTLGYKHTSISDITSATGLTKGAIYRHFRDKSELECEALKFMLSALVGKLTSQIKEAQQAPEKLNAILDYFSAYRIHPPFEGGCPLMNAATEADDAHPELKALASHAMETMHQSVETIITKGIKYQQLKPDINIRQTSSLFFSAIEGAIMMMKLTDKGHHLQSVITYLRSQIEDMRA